MLYRYTALVLIILNLVWVVTIEPLAFASPNYTIIHGLIHQLLQNLRTISPITTLSTMPKFTIHIPAQIFYHNPPPIQISLFSPQNGQPITEFPPIFSVSVVSILQLPITVTYQLDNGASQESNKDESGHYYFVASNLLNNGNYKITINAIDSRNNKASYPISVDVEYPTRISILNPQNSTTLNPGDVQINGIIINGGATVAVRVSVDNTPIHAVQFDSTSDKWSATISNLSLAPHAILVEALDDTGKVVAHANLSFTIANPPCELFGMSCEATIGIIVGIVGTGATVFGLIGTKKKKQIEK